MNDLPVSEPKRKVLTLKKAKPDADAPQPAPRYVNNNDAVFMVWCADGDMPKRVYRNGERDLAVSHAKALARQNGRRFYVMRAWRGYDPE